MGPPLPGTKVKSESLTTFTISRAEDTLRHAVGIGKEKRRGSDPDDVLLINGVIHLDGYRGRRSVRQTDFCAVKGVLVAHRYAIDEGWIVHDAVECEAPHRCR